MRKVYLLLLIVCLVSVTIVSTRANAQDCQKSKLLIGFRGEINKEIDEFSDAAKLLDTDRIKARTAAEDMLFHVTDLRHKYEDMELASDCEAARRLILQAIGNMGDDADLLLLINYNPIEANKYFELFKKEHTRFLDALEPIDNQIFATSTGTQLSQTDLAATKSAYFTATRVQSNVNRTATSIARQSTATAQADNLTATGNAIQMTRIHFAIDQTGVPSLPQNTGQTPVQPPPLPQQVAPTVPHLQPTVVTAGN